MTTVEIEKQCNRILNNYTKENCYLMKRGPNKSVLFDNKGNSLFYVNIAVFNKLHMEEKIYQDGNLFRFSKVGN